MALNKDLLDILVCPLCRGRLELVNEQAGLQCPACAVVFPIQDEIPVMLPAEAIPLSEWEHGRRKAVPQPETGHS